MDLSLPWLFIIGRDQKKMVGGIFNSPPLRLDIQNSSISDCQIQKSPSLFEYTEFSTPTNWLGESEWMGLNKKSGRGQIQNSRYYPTNKIGFRLCKSYCEDGCHIYSIVNISLYQPKALTGSPLFIKSLKVEYPNISSRKHPVKCLKMCQ